MEPKYLLIVTEPAGWIIRDTPRPESQGALRRRAEVAGKPLHAYEILPFDGVPYAYLVPQVESKPEWGRVSEVGGIIFNDDGSFRSQVLQVKSYVRVIPLAAGKENAIAAALREIADAVRSLKGGGS